MKKWFLISLIIPVIISCGQNTNNPVDKTTEALQFKNEVINFAANYAMEKFKTPLKTVATDGTITIEENQNSYMINPSKVYLGLIDYDNIEDAIVSIDYYHGQFIVLSEHLFLINSENKLTLNRSIESDMKILGIKDRVITAEVYTRSRNGPLANCNVCKEVVKYQFRQGELIKIAE
jgi:hypothetical protein